ncbi:MAG: hypothetical protein DMG23_13070 [Acidobacteria bacterium]|nr:MAG: hypothetical protein DMG23_13070 [Acidobacteriota bacterium]
MWRNVPSKCEPDAGDELRRVSPQIPRIQLKRAYSAKFGVGFALLILIHEMGHFIDVKRRGLPAEMPVFLPGLGAYVQWQALGVSRETRVAAARVGVTCCLRR